MDYLYMDGFWLDKTNQPVSVEPENPRSVIVRDKNMGKLRGSVLSLLLALLYWFVVTPIAWKASKRGRLRIDCRRLPKAETRWVTSTATTSDTEQFRKAF
jgi:hypothetical protein